MAIVLFRVDERLIHGQVVVGWGGPLDIDRIVVIDDAISSSGWEQELYCLGVPPEVDASFATVAEASAAMGSWRDDEHRRVVLVRDVATALRLAEAGALKDVEVNLGGIHHAAGRERVLPYLYLSDMEREQLATLRDLGIGVTARDLPGSRKVALEDLLPDDAT